MADSERTPGTPATPRTGGGPRHALPDDMEPAPLPQPGDGPGSHRADADDAPAEGPRDAPAPAAARPAPAYESYEAPESQLMPAILAAAAGGVLAAVVLVRVRRARARRD